MDDTLHFSSILNAAHVLEGVTHRTPVMTSRHLDATIRGHVFLKCENFQRTGAFKMRGAYHALSQIKSLTTAKTVVTISSGNHGQALALSAKLLKLSAHVVMPEPITSVKYQAIVRYGGKVAIADSRRSAETMLQQIVAQSSAISVHAFNDFPVMAGQGTIMLELRHQVPELDVLLAPVGGGGLLSGLCVAAHHLAPSLKIFGCEPEGALDVKRSIEENRITPTSSPDTMADGLRTSLGCRTLPIIRKHLTDVFAVSEDEIGLAMRFAFQWLRIVIEPSAAVALAPVLRSQPELIGRRVGVVLTGGNVELQTLKRVLEG